MTTRTIRSPRVLAPAVAVLAGLCLAAGVWAQSAARDRGPANQDESPRPQKRQSFREQYGVLVERNIFVRDRARIRPRTSGGSSAPSGPRRPEQSFVLTGITMQEGRHVAFIENMGTGTTERVSPGTSVAAGKIVRVELDYLEYEAGGKRTRVGIGRNLAGDVATVLAPAAAPATGPAGTQPAGTQPAGAAPAPGGAPLPGDPNLSIEERMKLRRQQENRR